MKKTILLLCLFVGTIVVHAQSVGINTTNPDASSALDIQSTTQGMLVPRMTEAQRNLIATPATGLLVYQTDGTAGFYFYNGTAWTSLNGGGGTSLPSQTGNAGKYLKTDGTTASWDTPGMPVMTKAQRDALVSPADGTTIYQSDVYPGIYTKQYDGWRCMSGDGPIYTHDVGSPTTSVVPILTLDATHHTVLIQGNWSSVAIDAIQLPDARLCPGRKYRIVVNNLTTTEVLNTETSTTVRTYGWPARFIARPATDPIPDILATFAFKISRVPFTALPVTGNAIFGDARMTEIISTGTTWLTTQTNLMDPNEMND